jgi:hypothetical protein
VRPERPSCSFPGGLVYPGSTKYLTLSLAPSMQPAYSICTVTDCRASNECQEHSTPNLTFIVAANIAHLAYVIQSGSCSHLSGVRWYQQPGHAHHGPRLQGAGSHAILGRQCGFGNLEEVLCGTREPPMIFRSPESHRDRLQRHRLNNSRTILMSGAR